MIKAQPKTQDLLDQLNALRSGGVVIHLDFNMRLMKREIESLKNVDEADYHRVMAAFHAVTGNHEEMRRYCDICMNKYQDDESMLFSAASYGTAGFYSDAIQALSRLDYRIPSDVEFKFSLAEAFFQVRMLAELSNTLAMANALTDEFRSTFGVMHATSDILERGNIPLESVESMLDLAWEVMRENKILAVRKVSVLPDETDDTVTLLIPLPLPASTVANLDWEYTERLFEKFPDAPVQRVFVGFMTNDPAK